MDELQDTRNIPHVLIFPFPVQGHVTPMLRLAETLSFSNLKITFLNSHHNHHRLLRHSDVFSRFSSHPNFHFESISDGLPDDKHRSVDRAMLTACGTVMAPLFKELLTKLVSQRDSPVTCVIADGLMDFAVDITQEIGVKLVYFRIPSAAFFWVCWCIPQLIQSREFPFEDENMDQEITSIPGMENFLRRRDLPTFCRVYDLKEDLSFEAISLATQQTSRAHALILNTFDDLEGPTVARIGSHCVKVYTIGPLDAHLKHKRSLLAPKTATSNSLWEEDRGCLTWLDEKPLKSVIYVSFGSITVLTKAQLLEFWHGLVNSGRPFLWN
ncbi:hypothetical protein RJ641_035968 [Dillenia turbinata]|uniref:Uncharacterized protein n=1 Tax=Dillenia turbinata TaxID=194707 RepID=A0AAN8ZAK8_9MAGN